MKITLRAAEFSYAMLPNYYSNILGVTGTLEVIPEFKKDILRQRYDIKEEFLIPSAFGLNKKRKEEYHIVGSADLYSKVIKCMDSVDPSRPVIVFFNSIIDLNSFLQSPLYEQKGDKNVIALTELHEAITRK